MGLICWHGESGKILLWISFKQILPTGGQLVFLLFTRLQKKKFTKNVVA